MSRTARAVLGLVALLAVSMLPACGIRPAIADRGSDTLVVDLTSYPATLDPAHQYDTSSYSVYRNIFDQLLRRDPRTNKIVPWLAKSWHQDSPTRWTFAMRGGVKFSDGSPLTAEDAAYSIERILDPKFGSEQFANFSAIDSAHASGDNLVVRTKFPSPTLLSYLTTLSVVPKAYVRKVGDEEFNKHPVGSGPYQVAAVSAGSQIVLRRNPKWWRPRPQIRAVTFRSVPNVASKAADLQARKADIITTLTPDIADQVKRDPKLRILSTPTERVSYVAFNTIHGGAVNDPRVRKAIALSIDYRSLIANLQRDFAKRVNSVLTPLSTGYPKNLPATSYDPARARRLLRAAHASGATIVMANSPAYDPQTVQAIQANLADVGLKVKIENTDQPTYLKKVQSPDHKWGSMRFGNWSCSCLDADGVAYPLFRTGSVWSSYHNPAFDHIVDSARTTDDPAERTRLYERAYQVLARDTPGIGLFQSYAIYGALDRVKWKPDVQESFFVADMKVTS
ncbi:MAG: ABC transporter substrate-binding protein [Actinocatenispora sp.]